ncbi:MAG TPA: class I SAM-dependent methyltransferase [Puia sp.]|nr:class I SAM-dependent methyltransferase [Puia sp.]
MTNSVIDKTFGREAFGLDPAGYHAARPAYPDWVYEVLCERCGLRPNVPVFEIGAGTGIATRRLLELGANPLMAIEPDDRLADFLAKDIEDEALTVIRSSFEDVVLPATFDLGFCATAFHWLNEETALMKVADLLRPGGWWAMVWNVFGDPVRPDPFHEASKLLLAGPMGPSGDDRNIPFALDKEARLGALERANAFEDMEYRAGEWSLVLDPDQTVNLYATYSNINVRPDREAVLAELGRIAREEFNGRVTRNMTTCLYIARRRSSGAKISVGSTQKQ